MISHKAKLLTLCFTAVTCPLALAHEGHGHTTGQGNTPTHYFTEPLHLIQFAAIGLTVFVIGWIALKRFLKNSDQAVHLD